MQKWLESTDKNRDGNLSKEEWQEMRDNMKQQVRSGIRGRFR